MSIKIIFLVVSLFTVLSLFSLSFPQKKEKDFSVSSIVVPRQIELSNIKANKIKELQINKIFVFRSLFESKYDRLAEDKWKISQPKFLYQILYYDKNGRTIETETWDRRGELSRREFFEYNKNGQMTTHFEELPNDRKLVITYDRYGRVLSKAEYDIQDKKLFWKKEFILDNYGDPTTMNEFDYKGNLSNSKVFGYHKEGSSYFVEPNPDFKPVGYNQIGDTICVGYSNPYENKDNFFIKIKYDNNSEILSRSKGNYYEIYDDELNLIKSKWDYTDDNYVFDNDEHFYEYNLEGYCTGQTVYRTEYVGRLTNESGDRVSDERGYIKYICGLYSYEYEINKDSISSMLLGKWDAITNKVKNVKINNNQRIELNKDGVCIVSLDNIYGRRTEKESKWYVTKENLIKIIPVYDKKELIMYFRIGDNTLTLEKIEDEGKIESSESNEIVLIYVKK